jgi:nucleoside-diphosphate-sugar epimerase
MLEVAPHPVAFVVDLLGKPEIEVATAGNRTTLPSGITLARDWRAIARAGESTAVINLSLTPGQADRLLHVRGRGGSVVYDFGRDFGTLTKTASDNPMLEAWQIANGSGKALREQAREDIVARVRSALAKRPDSGPFEACVYRSIQAFYAGGVDNVDPRHNGRFGVAVMQTCEAIAAAAGEGPAVTRAVTPAMPQPLKKPDVLVVGGTGFIGRRLVQKLVERGHGVRILSRSANGAAFQFAGVPVEIMAGSHGDPETARRAVEGVDTVVHLAKAEGKRWQDYLDNDIAPTRVLGEAARAVNVRRFLYTGTIDSYASDDASKVIDCDTPVDPKLETRNHYARSKATCEAVLREIGVPLVIMRPAVVIGSGSPPAHLGIGRFSGETRVEYWGDGRNMLPLVSVEDVAEALALGVTTPGIDSRQFVLSSPPLLNARDYVAAYEQISGSKIEQIERSPMRFWIADFGKEALKNAIRHPNRRKSTLHDWACKAHQSRYDSSEAMRALGWTPISDRQVMIDEAIAPMIRSWMA